MMKKPYFIVFGIIILILATLVINQFFVVRKAHSSFDNYYAFRGCKQLIVRTDTYAQCKIDSGQTIKIVKYQNKWYLDGDLPVCHFGICF